MLKESVVYMKKEATKLAVVLTKMKQKTSNLVWRYAGCLIGKPIVFYEQLKQDDIMIDMRKTQSSVS
jgi:hypothetical protein